MASGLYVIVVIYVQPPSIILTVSVDLHERIALSATGLNWHTHHKYLGVASSLSVIGGYFVQPPSFWSQPLSVVQS